MSVLLLPVSRRNSLRYLRTLKRFMYGLLTDVTEAALLLVATADNPIEDYIRLRAFSRLRHRIERWFFSHL
jgi:hypothetical protein